MKKVLRYTAMMPVVQTVPVRGRAWCGAVYEKVGLHCALDQKFSELHCTNVVRTGPVLTT
jgi:hypothetical protein